MSVAVFVLESGAVLANALSRTGQLRRQRGGNAARSPALHCLSRVIRRDVSRGRKRRHFGMRIGLSCRLEIQVPANQAEDQTAGHAASRHVGPVRSRLLLGAATGARSANRSPRRDDDRRPRGSPFDGGVVRLRAEARLALAADDSPSGILVVDFVNGVAFRTSHSKRHRTRLRLAFWVASSLAYAKRNFQILLLDVNYPGSVGSDFMHSSTFAGSCWSRPRPSILFLVLIPWSGSAPGMCAACGAIYGARCSRKRHSLLRRMRSS